MSDNFNRVKDLVGLNDNEWASLTGEGVESVDDLGALEDMDIDTILPEASILKKRKLYHVVEYASGGQRIRTTTTMANIIKVSKNPRVAPAADAVPAVDESQAIWKGAPKLYVNQLEPFDGNKVNWETWEVAIDSTIGQTAYSPLLSRQRRADEPALIARNKEFFNMLRFALKDGNARFLVGKATKDDGHSLWNMNHTARRELKR